MTTAAASTLSAAVFGILLTLLSQSVCLAEVRPNDWYDQYSIDRAPRSRTIMKTPDGKRPARETVDVVTSTSRDGTTRHLASGTIECRLWEQCSIRMKHEAGGFARNHQWMCSFDPALSDTFGGYKDKVLVGIGHESIDDFLKINKATSGSTVLVLSEAEVFQERVVIHFNKMVALEEFDPEEKFVFESDRASGANVPRLRTAKTAIGDEVDDTNDRRHRGLKNKSTTGTLSTLLVKVNALLNGTEINSPSADELSATAFQNVPCMKSQYAECSYDQLTIQQYEPGSLTDNVTVDVAVDAPGVVTISVDIDITEMYNMTWWLDVDDLSDITDLADITVSQEYLQFMANSQLAEKFGVVVDDLDDLFDLVMFCMPPGAVDVTLETNWVGYAVIHRWDSYYNDIWGLELSVQMHEVGHSLGLQHSGEIEEYGYDEYSDLTGYMSYEATDADTMCFNPAKSWQLGWYEDKQIEINPTELSTEPTSYILNGFVDFGNPTLDAYVILKIGNYYIGYNRKTGFNNGTREAVDRVTLTEKMGNAASSAQSQLKKVFEKGDEDEFSLSDVTTRAIKIRVLPDNEIDNTNLDEVDILKDVVIELSVTGSDYPVECAETNLVTIQVKMVPDKFQEETSWGIMDDVGFLVYKNADRDNKLTYVDLCRGRQYYAVIDDTNGDGICSGEEGWGCGNFNGKYPDGTEIWKENKFEYQKRVGFIMPLPVGDSYSPTSSPTDIPSDAPSGTTSSPTALRTSSPTSSPTASRTSSPTSSPTALRTSSPTSSPTAIVTTQSPTVSPTVSPTPGLTTDPTVGATANPSVSPTASLTADPTAAPEEEPSPTGSPTTLSPSSSPTASLTGTDPTAAPEEPSPTGSPITLSPSARPTASLTGTDPTAAPEEPSPTGSPTNLSPSASPTASLTGTGPTAEPEEPSPTGSPITLSPSARPTASLTGTGPTAEPEEPSPTGSPTASPTPLFPLIGPETCPNDILLMAHTGITAYPDDAVRIISQDSTTVTINLAQTFTSPDLTIDNIFYQYKTNVFDTECLEEIDFHGEELMEITIECTHSSQIALLELWIADDITKGVLSEGDNAIIPDCCHATVPEGTPVTKYLVEIKCMTDCPELVA